MPAPPLVPTDARNYGAGVQQPQTVLLTKRNRDPSASPQDDTTFLDPRTVSSRGDAEGSFWMRSAPPLIQIRHLRQRDDADAGGFEAFAHGLGDRDRGRAVAVHADRIDAA